MEERASLMEAIRLAGSIILENGGETYRVEDTVQRLGLALGAEDVQAFAVTSGVFITLTFPDGEIETKVYRAHRGGTQLDKVDEVNQVSRQAAEGKLNVHEVLAALKKIKGEGSRFSPRTLVLACAFSSAAFAVMFGGGWVDFGVSFITGVAVQCLLAYLTRFQYSQVMQSLLGGALCMVLPTLFNQLTGLGVVDAMVGGNLMPILPGVAMTNAVQDIMRGDMLSGVGHAMQAILTAALIAGGGIVATRLLFVLEGVL